jgi:PBP1b-binding outer membrane lipoprotein LpoB
MAQMMKNFSLVLLVCLLVTGCEKTPDEEQIKIILDNITTAVEKGNLQEVADHMHRDFVANHNMDLLTLKRMLTAYSMQHTNISITRVATTTTMDPVYTDKATTVLSVVMTGGPGRIPNDGSVRKVTLEWLKDGDWKIHRASW